MTRSSVSRALIFLSILAMALALQQGCRPRGDEAASVAANVAVDEPAAVEAAEAEAAVAPPVAETSPGAEPPAAAPPPRQAAPAASPAVQPRPAPPAEEPRWSDEPAYQESDYDEPSYAEPAAPPPPPRPALVRVPSGTRLSVELGSTLSSHTSQVGQSFQASLTQDVAAEGRVALRKGTTVLGKVTEASPAKKIGGRARLSLEFHTLKLADGQRLPLQAVFAEVGKSQRAKDAAIIGGSTIGGAILGEAIDEGEGTKIGAVVGGLAGAAIAKKTQGKPVELPAGTVLTLELTQPVTVEVSR